MEVCVSYDIIANTGSATFVLFNYLPYAVPNMATATVVEMRNVGL